MLVFPRHDGTVTFAEVRYGSPGTADGSDTLPIDDLIKNAVIMASYVHNAAMDDVKVPGKGHRL